MKRFYLSQNGRAKLKTISLIGLSVGGLAFGSQFLKANAEPEVKVNKIEPLNTVPVPGPPPEVLAQFIKDKKAAIQLGKALFWEQRVGSDNRIACASCHFAAGADPRIKNQLSPGLNAGDTTFQLGGTNYTLRPADFPLRRDINDVVSSQGVFNSVFLAISPDAEPDSCNFPPDAIFHGFTSTHQQINTRRVEPRNTPSVFNAVFNFRNFWDGRANNVFNGVDPFGLRNQNSFVWKVSNGMLTQFKVAIPTSSLASQADGPPLSNFEMSCAGRAFADIGRKLLGQKILKLQDISPTDSVLGPHAMNRPKYEELVKQAFRDEFWSGGIVPGPSARAFSMHPNGRSSQGSSAFTQMESNFSLFFGLSVQLYEQTLVSDDTPFDRFADGDNDAMPEQAKRGMSVFNGKGSCIKCHGGPEFTNASVASVKGQRLLRMNMGNGRKAVYDNGFYNIGVRPTDEDVGVGGKDPFGNPLSETLMVKNGLTDLLNDGFDPEREPTADRITRAAVFGAFKTPGLRNVELTGPYFHNGGKGTLRQVVDFYDRGGDFPVENVDNLDPRIRPIGLSPEEKQELVSFLIALTDERVKFERAPFDHPSLCVNNGHVGDNLTVFEEDDTGNAQDETLCIPAVGAAGSNVALKPFLNLDPFDPGSAKKK